MPPPPPVHYQDGPSIWQKMKMGALMGGGVGLTIGFIFGSWSIIRGGAGPRGFIGTLSQYMLSSAATFSFFLAIGSVIRSDSLMHPHLQEAQMRFSSSTCDLRSRVEGARLIKAQWEAERRRMASAKA